VSARLDEPRTGAAPPEAAAQFALDSIHEAVVRIDPGGRVEWSNRALGRLLRASSQDLVGCELAELLPLWSHGRILGEREHPAARTARGESGLLGVFETNLKADGRQWIQISAVTDPRADGGLLVISEVTQERLIRQDVQAKTAQLELLQDIAFASNNSTSLCDAMQYSLSRLADYQGWPLAHIWLCEADLNRLAPADLWHCTDWGRFGPFIEATRQLSLPAGSGLPGRVLARERPAWIADIEQDENFPRKAEALACGLRGGFAFPVLCGARVQAVLELFSGHVIEPDEHLLMLVEQAGALLGRVAERESAALEKRRTQAELEDRVLERTAALQQLNSNLKKQVEQRRRAERIKDELVATVSHELRTPLAGIRGFAELLLSRDFPLERRQEMLGVILKEAVQLTELIDDLLDVQKLAVGELAYHYEDDVDLCALVEQAVEGAAAQTSEHRITIEQTEPPPAIRADPKRIRQVLNNLLSNAIRYSPGGGRITVTVGRRSDDAEVAVADEGIGIPAKLIDKLFTKFYRVDNTATRSINGTGLGLALIKSIVEDHGGDVSVESVEGEGSVFSFRLPAGEVSPS